MSDQVFDQAVGILNDLLNPTYGAEAVRYSLTAAAFSKFVAVALFLWATVYLAKDLRARDA